MQDPQQWFNTIAQMIVQSAAASAAQDEARMQREQDLSFRREQLGLDRERLAQQGRLTDVQIEGQKTENEGRRLAVNKAKQKDATEMVDRELYFTKYGQYPEDRQAEVDRQTQDLSLSDAQNRNTVSSAEAENAPKAIGLKNEAARVQIDAAKSAQLLDAYRLESEKAMEGFRKASAEAQLRGANIANSNATLELAKARRNELYARLGLTTPEQKAALGAQFDADLQRAFVNAAEKSAIKTDAMGNQVFDMDEFQKSLAKVEAIGEASAKFKLLQKSQPDQAGKIQGALKIMGEQLMRTTSDPDAVGQALVTSLGAMVDSVGGIKPKTDKVAPPPTPKPPGEISVRMKPKDDKKEKARQLKVDSNRNVIAKYLAENTDELRQLREIVAKRVGGKDLATDERIIDYVKSRFSPEGGMDPGGFGLSEAIPNMIAFENRRK